MTVNELHFEKNLFIESMEQILAIVVISYGLDAKIS